MDNGQVRLHPDDELFAHVYEHVVFDGHQPPAIIETVIPYSFILTAIQDAFSPTPPHPSNLTAPENSYMREIVPFYDVDMPFETRSTETPFGRLSFMFDTNDNQQAEDSYTVAFAHLQHFQAFMASRNISVRLVTIPFFPAGFYEMQSGADWTTTIDNYDIFLPEERLATFADEIDMPFISLGAVMQAQGMSVSEISGTLF